MAKISRARRAELQRAAHELRRQGQRDGWPVARIAAAIRSATTPPPRSTCPPPPASAPQPATHG
jgi:hypothetical protein